MKAEEILFLAELVRAELCGEVKIEAWSEILERWVEKNPGEWHPEVQYRKKPKPRVCWRNEYPSGLAVQAFDTKQEAINYDKRAIRQVKFVELND